MAITGSWRRVGAVAASAVVTLGLAACEEATPASEAIEQASTELEMLAMGGGESPLAEDRLREGYNSVLTTLRPAEAAEAGARRSAAASLAAQAQLGLAALAVSDALDVEIACTRKQSEIRNLQNHWTGLKSLEASLEAFDPAAEIARLEEERAARTVEVTAAQERLRTAQAELEAMRARITSLEEQARTKWREETEIRQGTVDLGEVDRSPLIEQATQVKRQGDAFDRQASETRAVLESREPALRDIEAEIDRLSTQGEQLSQAIESLRAEHEERLKLAAEAGDEATALAGRIAALADELSDLRGTAPAAWQEVAGACDVARAKARSASGTGDMAQIQAGSAEQMLADALSHQAAGCEAYASTMQLLADTQPALPGAEAYAEAAEGAAQKAAELRQMASAAYGEAAAAFEVLAGDDGRVARAMTQLTDRLKARSGGGAEPAGDPEAAPAEPVEAAPESAPEDAEAAG